MPTPTKRQEQQVFHWEFHEPNEVAPFALVTSDDKDAMLATDDAKGRVVLDFQSMEMREFILRAVNSHETLTNALFNAQAKFDLIANYGLPGEHPLVCFSCVKSIAAEALDKISQALAAAKQL